jgi:heme exporter protein D
MPDLGPHAGFILAAYGLALAVLGALVAWVVTDHRVQRRRLAELEGRGVRRRSAARAAAGDGDVGPVASGAGKATP